jgi:hypothetical protein
MQNLQGNQTLRDESEKPPATNAPSADIDAQFRLQTPIPPITACCQQAFQQYSLWMSPPKLSHTVTETCMKDPKWCRWGSCLFQIISHERNKNS